MLLGHPFYVATQYHPEYLSRPLKPSPPFHGFVVASAERKSVVKSKSKTNGISHISN